MGYPNVFVCLINIDDAIIGLKKFLDYNDSEFWGMLKTFRKDISRFKLGDLRNDLLHRNKIFKQQDKKGKSASEKSDPSTGRLQFQ